MPSSQEAPRARVFISCGQGKQSDERDTANAISKMLGELGFVPWVATEQQTLNGIKEHIFETLGNSEYFIFIDFKRERLVDGYRGSLFSHQELAVASYLGVELLAFRESGVKLEGLLSSIGGNAIQFDDRSTLPDKIKGEVLKRLELGEWNSNWRNELVLERNPEQRVDVPLQLHGVNQRFFHLSVRNQHRHKAATNCYTYLQKATNLDTSEEKPFPSFELKWVGYLLPYVNVPPLKERSFDAICISHDFPTRLQFARVFSDWGGIVPVLEGVGRYKLEYLVLSSNFPPAQSSFILTLASEIDSTSLI